MAGVIGMYLRLSDEDENQEESNSIRGQRELICDFIQHNKDLSNLAVQEFLDDGFSGTDFRRPGITALLEATQNGEISCIIVKDFSRFGRNYISVGTYLEEVFPSLGVRFIAINDGYDSNSNSCNSEFLSTAFKNLVYDLYSKDLSKKITSVRRIKAQQGNFISAFAPYGYQKDLGQKLRIDTETAPVVQRIFDMALEGIAKVEIARILNKENVPSPSMLRKMRGDGYSCVSVHEKSIWRPSTISIILKDQRYTGDGIYGKVKPTGVGSQKEMNVVRKDWVIVPNAHEGIIQRDTFLRVNAMFQNYQKRCYQPPHPLSKKVKCGACNHVISRKASKNKGRGATYRCPTNDVSEKFGCYQQRVAEKEIEDAIYYYLKALINIAWEPDFENRADILLEEKIANTRKSLKKQESALRKMKLDKICLYESFRQGEIGKEMFLMGKDAYEIRCKDINDLLVFGQKQLNELNQKRIEGGRDSNKSKEESLFLGLTKEVVENFVDVIVIEKNGYIKINWKFDDIFFEEKGLG
ncbi:recombinase family protein [Anaerotignum sp.]|uniref:recombinase family protein n=1 Tax=Anaerotignum sp. TaxID=2039241 RepID=UPI0028A6537D|nr:recombinase family protein [Anaerotignum sp.]